MIEKQLKEAEKLGFKKCIIPENNKKLLKEKFKLDIIGVKNIKDAMKGVRTIIKTKEVEVMRNDKGITMVALVITILLMIILAGITVATGKNTMRTAQFQSFEYELEQIQGKVDVIYQKMQDNDEQYQTWGKNVTESEEAADTLKLMTGINYSNIDNTSEEYYYTPTLTKYRLFTQSELDERFGISSNPGNVIINFETREVISVSGFAYEGEMYYTLKDINGK